MASTASTTAVTQDYNNILFGFSAQTTGSVSAGEINSWASLIDSGVFTNAQVASSLAASSTALNIVDPIIRLYQAAFNTAPDLASLKIWVASVEAGTNTIASITTAFTNSQQFINTYGASTANATTATAIVTAMYKDVLNRLPDTTSLNTYVAALTAGTVTLSQVLGAFSQSAEFVTNSASTVAAWQTTYAATNSYVQSIAIGANNGGTVATGTSVTLTTGADSVSGAVNTINGLIVMTNNASQTSSTFNVSDSINPSSGANLSLNVVTTDAVAATLAGYASTGVTTLTFKHTLGLTGGSVTMDTSGLVGLTGITVTGSNSNTTSPLLGTAAFTNVAPTANLTLGVNGLGESVSVTYTSTPTTAPTLTLAAGNDANVVTYSAPGTGITTLGVVTAGTTADVINQLNVSAKDKVINVSGTGGLTVGVLTGVAPGATSGGSTGGLDTSVTTFNASAETGNVAIFQNLASSATYTATAGSGTANVLYLGASTAIANTVKTTGFQTVGISATASLTVDVTNFSGVSTYAIASGTTAANTVTFNNLLATNTTLSFLGNDATGTTAQTFTGASLNLATTAATVSETININNQGVATSGAETIGALTLGAGYSNLTINVADTSKGVAMGAITLSQPASTAETLTFSGAVPITFTTATNLVDANTDISSISLSGLSGAFATTTTPFITTPETGNLTFTGGSGAEAITIGEVVAASKTQTFNSGAGADTYIVTGGTLGTLNLVMGNGSDSVTLNSLGGTGTNNITFGSGTDTLTIATGTGQTGTLNLTGGSGTDTLVFTGAGTAAPVFSAFSGVSVIQFATNTGAVVVTANVASGYAPTLAINDYTTQNDVVTFSGTSVNLTNVTFTGNGNFLLKETGTTGADTLTGSKTVSTIIQGGSGADTIDFVSGHTSAQTAKYAATTDTAQITITNPTTGTTSSLDIIKNAKTGDKIDISAFDNTTVTVGTATTLITTIATNTITQVLGNYTASSNTFVYSATGTDSLLELPTATTGTGHVDVVLVGYSTASSVAAAGVLTLA